MKIIPNRLTKEIVLELMRECIEVAGIKYSDRYGWLEDIGLSHFIKDYYQKEVPYEKIQRHLNTLHKENRLNKKRREGDKRYGLRKVYKILSPVEIAKLRMKDAT